MESDGGTTGPGEEERRLKSLLHQLRAESSILERLVYKGKNQHRRCPYFQSLFKVRRDLRLLLSAGLEEILSSMFQVIHGRNPAQRVYVLDRLKKKHPNGKHNVQERLLGVARLLSQMVEPILKAAVQVSFLLARSFFMGFSLTILALLARLRVLVQQILVDIVSVFNMVTLLSQKEHSVNLAQKGIEAVREYYPPCGQVLILECAWEGDKFVLLERMHKTETKNRGEDLAGESIPLERPAIQYEIIDVLNKEEDLGNEKIHEDAPMKEELMPPLDTRHNTSNASADTDGMDINGCKNEGDITNQNPLCAESTSSKVGLDSSRSLSLSAKSPKNEGELRKRVAFVSVERTALSETKKIMSNKKAKLERLLNDDDPLETKGSEDPFYSLLTAGTMKNSLF